MIIKIHKAGRSFKGVSRYLTHDAKAGTAGRVAWTHTLNLASDDVPSAVDEMLWTFRAADQLKRQAGVATGGSRLDKPVKHFSLSWPQGEAPTQDHMVETVRAYMKHMGWSEHQAVLVAHNDTRHSHVHVVMNVVSPVDGRAARNFRDWQHSEAFALAYERAHEQIHCEQRVQNKEQREATPTRDSWQRFKPAEVAFEREEVERLTKAPIYFERHDAKLMHGREWEALKAYQKSQREQFFIEGKEAFRAVRKEVFREVREEFRPQWSAHYAAKRHGHDRATLAEMKIALVNAQNRAIDERRERACAELREQRDQAYEAILAQQRFDRAELGNRQQQGLRTYALMDVVYPARENPVVAQDKRERPRRDVPPSNRAQTADLFAKSAGEMIDPPSHRDRPIQTAPGVLRRDETSAKSSQGSGREPHAVRVAVQDQADSAETRRAVLPGNAERAKAPAEKAHQAAREQRDKEHKMEAAALRASWNHHRRWRGGRD